MDRRLTLGIGDNREHCFYIPVGFHLIRLYIDQGFELEELVIKRQRYCSAFGLGTYLCVQFDFLVFTHEFIATFKKVPKVNADRMLLMPLDDSGESTVYQKSDHSAFANQFLFLFFQNLVQIIKPALPRSIDLFMVYPHRLFYERAWSWAQSGYSNQQKHILLINYAYLVWLKDLVKMTVTGNTLRCCYQR